MAAKAVGAVQRVRHEDDVTRGGRSVLDIRPPLWSADGWAAAADNLAEGTSQILSRLSENTLQVHVPPGVVRER
jgi:hypothetical protein